MTVHFVNLLDALLRRSVRMGNLVEDMVQEAAEAVFSSDERLARRVISRDEEVDLEEVAIEAETIRLLALYQPVGSDLRLLCAVLKVNNDLERVADCAVNMAERACHLDPASPPPSLGHVQPMAPIVRKMLQTVVQAYEMQDARHAEQVFSEEHGVDALYGQVIKRAAAEDADMSGDTAAVLDVLSVAKNLERIADHATNIAENIIYLATGNIVRHRR